MNKCEGWSNEFELNMFHYNSMYTHTHTQTHTNKTHKCVDTHLRQPLFDTSWVGFIVVGLELDGFFGLSPVGTMTGTGATASFGGLGPS